MERGGGKIKRGADRHYGLMSTEDIIALPVMELAEDNCHLYLWVTNNFLPDGLKVMAAWGFRYVTKITWFKDLVGLGQYFRGNTEDCLFGVRGNPAYKVGKNGKRGQGVTGFYSPRGGHSEKPHRMRQMIEEVSHPPYVELFARDRYPGWDTWGNEAEGKDPGQLTII